MNIPHKPVLLNEIIDLFKEIKDGYIVDCTLGYGGHSEAILESNKNVKLICIDQDEEAINFSKKRLESYSDRIIFIKGRFSHVIKNFCHYDIRGILADIGVSSLQFDKKSRGFSFESQTLDMRMDTTQNLTAKDVINSYSKSELQRVFKEYGEIKEYKKLANLIIQQRERKPFESAMELSEFISKHFYSKKIHPATLAFQAIRIEVNDELGELNRLFDSIENLETTKCLVAIISFHSLEDRIVKQRFKKWSNRCICPDYLYRCECGNNNEQGIIVTKKPIIPTGKEIANNRRSRSSKLRVFKKQRKHP